MRVLSIFYKNKKGGLGKRLHQLYQYIVSEKHNLNFISTECLPFRDESICQHIIRTPFLKQENFFFWLSFIVSAYLKAYTISKKHHIDRIVTFFPFYTTLCCGPLRAKNIPAITFIRGDNQRHSRNKARNMVFYYLDMLGIKLSRKIVFVSSALRNTYKDRYRIPEEKTYVLPNNIDRPYRIEKEKKDELRQRLNIAPETFLLSTMGDVNRIKNHEHIIRAMAHLNDSNVKLMIIGDDVKGSGERKRLESLTQSLSLGGKVLFCGWQDEPLQYVACSNLFVFPSKYEGSPNALLEGLSCGIPCIGSDTDEIKEVLEYPDLLFSLSSERELSGMIGKAMSDADYYSKISLLSQERCEKFRFDWGKRAVSLIIDN